MYVLSNMSILGIHVKFQGGISLYMIPIPQQELEKSQQIQKVSLAKMSLESERNLGGLAPNRSLAVISGICGICGGPQMVVFHGDLPW